MKALTIFLLFYSTTICLLFIQHVDIEIDPGPRKKKPKYFSCCYWNVNSLLLTEKKYQKMSLLTAYNTIHQYDVIYLKETFFDSSLSFYCHNRSIQGYSLNQADHPDDVERDGLCLYLKKINFKND